MSTKDTRTQALSFDQVRQVLQGLPDYILPNGLREWNEQASDPPQPTTSGNWSLFFKSGGLFLQDDAGNITGPLVDATGSGGLVNAYADITDGTTTASASGGDTFKFRTGNNILTVVVGSNDATHGDNALFTIQQANIDHGSIGGLSDDDHTQYHDDTRGDARYFREGEHLDVSAGSSDAGKPIKLDADGRLDATMRGARTTRRVTADYSLVLADEVVMIDTSALTPITITLLNPNAVKDRRFTLKKVSSDTTPVTVRSA